MRERRPPRADKLATFASEDASGTGREAGLARLNTVGTIRFLPRGLRFWQAQGAIPINTTIPYGSVGYYTIP